MKTINLIAFAGVLSIAALSGPVGAATLHAKPAAKLIEVRTCPGTGEKVTGNGAGSEIVGKYKVYFCCGGCQPEFDKLSKAQKLTKLASLAPKAK